MRVKNKLLSGFSIKFTIRVGVTVAVIVRFTVVLVIIIRFNLQESKGILSGADLGKTRAKDPQTDSSKVEFRSPVRTLSMLATIEVRKPFATYFVFLEFFK